MVERVYGRLKPRDLGARIAAALGEEDLNKTSTNWPDSAAFDGLGDRRPACGRELLRVGDRGTYPGPAPGQASRPPEALLYGTRRIVPIAAADPDRTHDRSERQPDGAGRTAPHSGLR